VKFLIDSGADFSLLPRSLPIPQLPNVDTNIPNLQSVTGHQLKTYGRVTLPIELNGKYYINDFIIADCDPILGSDFLASHNLLVDCHSKTLVSHSSPPNMPTINTALQSHTCSNRDLQQLLEQFSEIFEDNVGTKPVEHPIQHHINTRGPIISSRPYRIPIGREEEVKAAIRDLLNRGIIRPSASPFSSPLILVPKSDGTSRPCVDYRRLNANTLPDKYPLPRIEDLIRSAKGKIFSKVDLRSGYHQIPVHPADIPKTATITPFGLYEFVRMPFGLRTAGSTFQRFIDYVVRGLDGVVAYVDDILVFSDSWQQHLQQVTQLLCRLRQFGLRLKTEKCVWGQTNMPFLGYLLSSDGYLPDPERIEKLLGLQTPKNSIHVRRVIGMFNYYRQFLPNFSQTMAPLYGAAGKFEWTAKAQQSFESLKSSLAKVTQLTIPSASEVFHIYTDASSIAIGSAIHQKGKPLAFYSKLLSPAEQNYSTFDREALAVVKTLQAYHHWFDGSKVVVHTDHKPLLGFQKMQHPSGRQARWIHHISQLDVTWIHLPGSSNAIADCLSRPMANDANIDSIQAAATIENSIDRDWEPILQSFDPRQEWPEDSLAKLSLHRQDNVWYNVHNGQRRLAVPPPLTKEAFNSVHDIAHLGRKKTLQSISSRFVWPNMNRDITKWVQTCVHCQTSKANKHTHHSWEPFIVEERFHTVHIDLVGPLPTTSKGKSYILTMIDHFTRWVEAVPMSNISAQSCAQQFLSTWVSRYGLPVCVVSDQGTQFESVLFNSMLQRLGIQRRRATAYHPQTNGAVERCHRTIKTCLRAVCSNDNAWDDALPIVLMGLRSSICESTQVPPVNLVLGSDVRMPADLIAPDLKSSSPCTTTPFEDQLVNNIQKFTDTAIAYQPSRPAIQPPRMPSWVWVKDAITRPGVFNKPYSGPYKVISQDRAVVTINIKGKETKVNMDRLKPAHLLEGENLHPTTTASNNALDITPSLDQPTTCPSTTTQMRPLTPTSIPFGSTSRYGRTLHYNHGGPRYK
jgi:hypothetical protein